MYSLAERVLPQFLQNQIKRYLIAHNKIRADGEGVASARTQESRSASVLLAYAEIWQLGYHIKKPESLADKHIRALVSSWDKAGRAAASIHTRLSDMRTFAGWMGKGDVVGHLSSYLPRERTQRTTIAKENRSWEAKGIDVDEVIAIASMMDPRFGAILGLQRYFGLRVKESIEIRPMKSLTSSGDYIELDEGTKGGKVRVVKIKIAAQRAAIETAIRVASKGSGGRLRWPDCNWKQAQRRFYLYMGKLNMTRKGAGVTAHGLRHEFLQSDYEIESGYPPPIKGGALGQISGDVHRMTQQTITRAAGHGRRQVTATYCGSYGHLLRIPPESITINGLKRSKK